MTDTRTPSNVRNMPSVKEIVAYWRSNAPDWLYSNWIGWGEPFCFGCHWLPPVPDGRANAWIRAGRWLDRAHLQDHVISGNDAPHNIVMLCHLCHGGMPGFEDANKALDWIRHLPAKPSSWQSLTDQLFDGSTIPHRATTLLRAHAEWLDRRLYENATEGDDARFVQVNNPVNRPYPIFVAYQSDAAAQDALQSSEYLAYLRGSDASRPPILTYAQMEASRHLGVLGMPPSSERGRALAHQFAPPTKNQKE